MDRPSDVRCSPKYVLRLRVTGQGNQHPLRYSDRSTKILHRVYQVRLEKVVFVQPPQTRLP